MATDETSTIISASMLAANLAALAEDGQAAIDAGANWLHFDVMDFHFVPNLSFGPCLCKALRQAGITATIDVHLMVDNPDKYIIPFAKAGANYLLFHPETSPDVLSTIDMIKQHGMKPGLVYNPKTELTVAQQYWPQLDAVLIMTVEPGFGGQALIPACIEKIKQAKAILAKQQKSTYLGVDGGINVDTIASASQAGANYFVSGSGIFNGGQNYSTMISQLRDQIMLQR